ncbi:MAG: HNH endonuclease [Acidobacteria bacterium]|nr:HNH endonuclease [Acidobacteriota bacterium]
MKRTYDSRPVRSKPSRFKGVYLTKAGRWTAILNTGKQYHYLGRFDTEEEAALEFDKAALKYRGPDTFLNFRDLGAKTDPIIEGNTALVPTTAGTHFRIDTRDLPEVSRYYWNGETHLHGGIGRGTTVTLHQLLLGQIPRGHCVIHVNGDPLDHRRANLMVVSRKLHSGAMGKRKGTTQSIYKGVRQRNATTWHARIEGRHIGAFPTPEDAARAFDEAARALYGPFAALNFPEPGERSCLPPAA